LLDGFLSSLAEDLQRQPFAKRVRSLLLAGGYGRGEGGIFRASEDAAPQLYNDLEFYLITSGGGFGGEIGGWCARQSHAGDALLGIEVEFKLIGESAFRSASPSMFYYDLLAAHRMVFGSGDFTKSLPARLSDPALIPSHEAARLLFNRGTGLFFSRTALELGDERVGNGFIERNHAKARLALADAVLAFNGQYHFSCRERHSRLEKPLAKTPPDWVQIKAWHAEGLEFKLHPRHRQPSAGALNEAQRELSRVWLNAFLWLESWRLGVEFGDAAAYAWHRDRLFPDAGMVKNIVLHVRDRLKRGAALPGWSDYPRAALQRALALVLQKKPDVPGAGKALGMKTGCTLPALHDTYERWWRFYN
jgi:hypothetical protein